jgi:hypothetical protein
MAERGNKHEEVFQTKQAGLPTGSANRLLVEKAAGRLAVLSQQAGSQVRSLEALGEGATPTRSWTIFFGEREGVPDE